eukprot:scaffold72384_cov42-Cyclotella_meneghiniana.AAC.1
MRGITGLIHQQHSPIPVPGGERLAHARGAILPFVIADGAVEINSETAFALERSESRCLSSYDYGVLEDNPNANFSDESRNRVIDCHVMGTMIAAHIFYGPRTMYERFCFGNMTIGHLSTTVIQNKI